MTQSCDRTVSEGPDRFDENGLERKDSSGIGYNVNPEAALPYECAICGADYYGKRAAKGCCGLQNTFLTDGGQGADSSGEFRRRAPGQPKDHPDWFWSLSSGIDSVAAFLLTKDALESSKSGGNFAKKPVAIYLDTRIGVPLNRLYVEQLCDTYGVQLWTLRTDESFLEWLRRDGAPGGGAHQEVRNELKDRQASKLVTLADNPVMVLGLAADESQTRAEFPKIREMRRHMEIYPVHRLTRKERAEIILRHEECPRNPLWEMPAVITDCGCLANGDPSELKKTEEHFPTFGQRLREWEESITHDGLKGTLGWGGLTAEEKRAKIDGQMQRTLTTCTDGCQRDRDSEIVRAFKTRSNGATVKEAMSILYESNSSESWLVATADDGKHRSVITAVDMEVR